MTWRTATKFDQDLCISKPGWETTEGKGPLDKWKAEWVNPGLFTRHEGKIIHDLPSTCAAISHWATNTVPVRTVALLRVQPDEHVCLLLMTKGPDSIVRLSDLQVPPRPPATPPGFVT